MILCWLGWHDWYLEGLLDGEGWPVKPRAYKVGEVRYCARGECGRRQVLRGIVIPRWRELGAR